MKKLVYSIFSLLLVFSQLTAQIDTFTFTTTFYFEDAVGNRDSVKWSGWPQGNVNDPDQTYGESVSDQPFDPVFEVRAFSSSEYDPSPPYVDAINTYKHFVSPWYPDPDTANCAYHQFYGRAPRFAVKSVNYPVTITWDEGLFHPDTGLFRCWLGAILIDNTTPSTFQYWWLESDFNHQFACMSYENSFVIHHDEDAIYFTDDFGSRGYFPVSGQEHIIDTTQAVIFFTVSRIRSPLLPPNHGQCKRNR